MMGAFSFPLSAGRSIPRGPRHISCFVPCKCSYFVAVSHFVVLYFTDHVDVSSCPALIQLVFSYSRGFSRPLGRFYFHISPLGAYGGAERAPSSHGLPNPWTCGDLDGSEQREGVPFLCHSNCHPFSVQHLVQDVYVGMILGKECYLTAEVFFVYVGLTPVCGEDRSSCELQTSLCRRVRTVRPPSVGAPTRAL
jgi:hypothetical protein